MRESNAETGIAHQDRARSRAAQTHGADRQAVQHPFDVEIDVVQPFAQPFQQKCGLA